MPVVQKLGSAIHQINNFPVDKYREINQLVPETMTNILRIVAQSQVGRLRTEVPYQKMF